MVQRKVGQEAVSSRFISKIVFQTTGLVLLLISMKAFSTGDGKVLDIHHIAERRVEDQDYVLAHNRIHELSMDVIGTRYW